MNKVGRLMAAEFLVVYHEPGDPSESARVHTLVGQVRQLTGVDVETSTLKGFTGCRGCKRVYLLMFTRGGHWLSLREHGVDAVLVPPYVTASAIVAELERRGLDHVLLVALRAKRLVDEQLSDIEFIGRLVAAKGLSVEVRILDGVRTAARPETGAPVAPLALLLGKLVRAACSLTQGPCLGPLLHYGWWHILAWLASDIRAQTQPHKTPRPIEHDGHGV